MNVIFNNYNNEDSDVDSINSEETDHEHIPFKTSARFSSVDFVKLYKNREGIGLYEPSLPRFPFVRKEAQDPRTKFSSIEDIVNNFKVGKQFDETMEGLTMARSQVTFVEKDKILFRGGYLTMPNRVKIISGGKGLFSDFVGKGMLTCAIMGTDGAPKSRVIFVAIRQLCKGDQAGLIALVPSNFEDELNWGLALARAKERGMNVAMIPVGDAADPSEDGLRKKALAGIVFYMKIAGAMAEENYTMREIYERLQTLNLATISCHVCDDGFKIFTDYEGQGGKLLSEATKEDVIKEMIRLLVDPSEEISIGYELESKFILLVNAYAGNRYFLNSITVEAIKQLEEKNIPLAQVYTGFYIQTPNLGFSITLLAEVDSNTFRWLDGFTTCPGWIYPGTAAISKVEALPVQRTPRQERIPEEIAIKISSALISVFSQIKTSEEILNEIDPAGEYGTKFCRTAQEIVDGIEKNYLDPGHPCDLFLGVADYFLDNFNNTDGIMYAMFFTGVAQAMLNIQEMRDDEPRKIEKKIFTSALKYGISHIESYFMVDLSDGTIVDIFGPVLLFLKAAKYEHSMIRGFDIALEIAAEKYNRIEGCMKKITASPHTTVYSAYVLTDAFNNYFKAKLDNEDGQSDIFKGYDLSVKSKVSICDDRSHVFVNLPTKVRKKSDEHSTDVKRVAERGDIFGNFIND